MALNIYYDKDADLSLIQRRKVAKIGRLEVKRDLCIGAQTCVALAGDVFEMDAENKAIVKNAKGADDETILMAARSCPTLAIFIYDEQDKQIFP